MIEENLNFCNDLILLMDFSGKVLFSQGVSIKDFKGYCGKPQNKHIKLRKA